ncbi:MAG: 4Fe-4S binding protein [Candidatus Omnitrophota bacterium]|nr:MAG: 4Fe-4S binding protein [Candidatus Omnitrophota bacterium]
MKYPKLREIKGALTSLFTRPYTTKFPKQPHIPFSSFRGKPQYDEEKCIGCAACVNVCPAFALSFEDIHDEIESKRVFTIKWDVCIECGQCQLNCPTEEGIVLSQEFDISTTETRADLIQRIEKEMIVCECCDELIACKDHLLWTMEKVGPLYTSNTTLITFAQRRLSVSDHLPSSKESLRSDRFTILCPRCRREAVVAS